MKSRLYSRDLLEEFNQFLATIGKNWLNINEINQEKWKFRVLAKSPVKYNHKDINVTFRSNR